MNQRTFLAAVVLGLSYGNCVAMADEPTKLGDKQALYAKLSARLTGATLKGRFTIDSKDDDKPRSEEYVISSAIKADQGEMWVFNTRIKYGDKDVSIPVPLEIQWAGETPVIVMNNATLPGLGTFSARVVLDETRYAGTWQHDKVGGHLFGTIAPRGDQADKK